MVNKIKLCWRALWRIDNWWKFFLDYLGCWYSHYTLRIKGKKVTIRGGSADRRIVTEVVLLDKYFPQDIRLTGQSKVIDLGAHIGLFSVLCPGEVWAFEPDAFNFRILKMNAGKNMHIFNMAVADKDGKVKLYQGEHSARMSTARKSLVPRTFEEVKAISLNSVFKKNKIDHCDLLKCDIEGGEYDVLYNTPDAIFKKINAIIMETHTIPGESQDLLVEFIRKKGFRIKRDGNFIVAKKSFWDKW